MVVVEGEEVQSSGIWTKRLDLLLLLGLQLGKTDELGHLLSLSLGTDVGSDLALGKTESALIEVDTEQLHKTLLIGGETDDLTDEITGESSALTKTTLVGNRGKTRGALCDGETTLLTDGDGEDVGVRLGSRHDGLTEEGKGGKFDARR